MIALKYQKRLDVLHCPHSQSQNNKQAKKDYFEECRTIMHEFEQELYTEYLATHLHDKALIFQFAHKHGKHIGLDYIEYLFTELVELVYNVVVY